MWKWVQGGKTKDGPGGIAAPSGVVAGTGNATAPVKAPGGYGGVAAPAPSAPAGIVAGTGNAGGSTGKQPNPYGGTTSDSVPTTAPPKIGTLNPGNTTNGGTPIVGTPNRPIPPVVIVAPPVDPLPPVSYLPQPQPGGAGAGTAPAANGTPSSTAIGTPNSSPRESVNRKTQPSICKAPQYQRLLDMQAAIFNATGQDVPAPCPSVSNGECAAAYADNEADSLDPFLQKILASTSFASLQAADDAARAYVAKEFGFGTGPTVPSHATLAKIQQALNDIIGEIATCVGQKLPVPSVALECTLADGAKNCAHTLLPVSQRCKDDPASCVNEANLIAVTRAPHVGHLPPGFGNPTAGATTTPGASGTGTATTAPVPGAPTAPPAPSGAGTTPGSGALTTLPVAGIPPVVPESVPMPVGGGTPGNPGGGAGTTPGMAGTGTATTAPVPGMPTAPPAPGGTGTSPGSGTTVTTPNPTVIPKPTTPPAVVNAAPGGAAPGSSGGGGGTPVVIAAVPNPNSSGSSGATAVASSSAAGGGSGTAAGSAASAAPNSNSAGGSTAAAAGSSAAGSTPGTATADATPAPSPQTVADACEAAANAVALNGRCTALIVGGSDHSSACNSRIVLTPNTNGGLTVCFAAFADRARVAFAGTPEANIDAQSNAALQSVDGVIFRIPNSADQIAAQGECKLGDPNQGTPANIDCHADTKDGPFVGSFQTDGTPPVQP